MLSRSGTVLLAIVLTTGPLALVLTPTAAAEATLVTGCRTIGIPGTFVLANDLNGTHVADNATCITISASDVTLDGRGHTLTAGSFQNKHAVLVGSEANPLTNVVLSNFTLTNWNPGAYEGALYYTYTTTGSITNVTATSNDGPGIYLRGASGVTLDDVTTSGHPTSKAAVYVVDSTDVTVTGLTSTDDGQGVLVSGGSGHVIRDSTFDESSPAVDLSDASGVVVRDNAVIGGSIASISGSGELPNRIMNNSASESAFNANDCGGFSVNGAVDDVIANNTVRDCNTGALIQGSEGVSFENNTIASSYGYGVYVNGGSRIRLVDNTIENNGQQYTPKEGLHLATEHATLTGNTFAGNDFNLRVSGSSWAGLDHVIDASNTVEGRPVAYHVNASGVVVDPNAGWVALVGSDNATVDGITFPENNYENVLTWDADDVTLRNLAATDGWFALWIGDGSDRALVADSVFEDAHDGPGPLQVDASVSVRISDTRIANSTGYGILLSDATGTTLDRVTVTGSDRGGLHVENYMTTDVTIRNSTISENDNTGVTLKLAHRSVIRDSVIADNGGFGILTDDDLIGLTLQGNTISGNTADAIKLSDGGRDGVVSGNVISNNDGYGLWLERAYTDLLVYDNHFNNSNNVLLSSPGSVTGTAWNVTPRDGTNVVGGPTISGNYWAHPDGTGHSQSCGDADEDGLCEAAFEVATGHTDAVPLATAVANSVPTASFTPNASTVTTGTPVQFTDASTDTDGTITSWAWAFGDGNTSGEQNPTHAFADDGAYSVTLTVTDDDGATDTASRTITVTNTGPTAAFTLDDATARTGQSISFTDTSTDTDGATAAWAWDFGDGNTSALQHPTHAYGDDGEFTVTLTVTDDDGATDSATQPVTITNVAPTAAFTLDDSTPSAGTPIQFTDTSTDSDGGITSWAWDFGDGNTSGEQNPTHTFADDGAYDVTLTVTDDDGATGSTTSTVVVPNAAPSASFTRDATTVPTGTPVHFTDTSTDGDGDVVAWAWSFGDGNTSAERHPSHAYADDGAYTITLTVTDDDGGTDSAQSTVTVTNAAPTAAFTPDANPVPAQTPVEFTDASTDSDGSITSWAWSFGDGNTSTTRHPTHAYTEEGDYVVTLTVTDDDGATSEATATITVTNAHPTISAVDVPTFVFVNESMPFDVTATDPDGDALTYDYAFGDGTTLEGAAATVTHAFDAAGTFEVAITARETADATAADTVTVDVRVDPVPVPELGPNVTATAGRLVVINGTITHPTEAALVATVDYGDGSDPEAVDVAYDAFRVEHTYATPGTYAVAVTLVTPLDTATTDVTHVTVTAPAVACVDDAFEENDAFAAAAPLPRAPGQLTGEVDAVLCDTDHYALDVPAGHFVVPRLDLADGAGGMDLTILSADGEELGAYNTSPDIVSLPNALAREDTTFTFRVDGAHQPYALNWSFGVMPPPVLFLPEPFNATAGQPFEENATVSGWMTPANVTVDYGDGTDPVNASVTFGRFTLNHTYATAGNHSIKVTACDTVVQCRDAVTLVNVTAAVEAPGNKTNETPDAPPSLEPEPEPAPEPLPEPTPGRTCDGAGTGALDAIPVPLDERVAGVVCDGAARWYAVNATAGDAVHAHLEFAHADGDLDVRLLTPGGRVLAAGVSSTNDEIVEGTAPVDGAYRLVVSGFLAASNHYNVTVRVTEGAAPTPPVDAPPTDDAPAEDDPAPVCDAGDGALPLATPVTGVACGAAGTAYALTLAEGDRLRVDVEFVHADGDLDLRLMGPGGHAIAAAAGLAGTEHLDVTVHEDGTYTLRVHGVLGARNAFTLSATVGA